MQIFITQRGTQAGPFTKEEIVSMLDLGTVSPSDLAWCEGYTDWVALEAILDINTPSKTPNIWNQQNVYVVVFSIAIVMYFSANRKDKKTTGQSITTPIPSYHRQMPMANQKITLTEKRNCLLCDGTGKDAYNKETCLPCFGHGTISTPSGFVVVCNRCGGSGHPPRACESCRGTGYELRTIEY